MRLTETALPGVFVVDVEAHRDARGAFMRTSDAAIFRASGLNESWPQCSISHNIRRGTLRGLHWQAEPKPEVKLVRCTRGSVFDVAVDLRPGSPAYLKWFGIELTAERRNALYVPAGCAHGFVTLADDTELFYQIGEAYAPDLARGARWNDPAFGIRWPVVPEAMSERDAGYPDFRP